MNKNQYINIEMAEIEYDRQELELHRYFSELNDRREFGEAVWCGVIHDKDAMNEEPIINHLFSDFDDFDTRMAFMSEEHSIKARHRKHRESRRMTKVNRRKNTHWVHYFDGTAKECKAKNHRAVRHEWDIPTGKSNFSHKIASCAYFY